MRHDLGVGKHVTRSNLAKANERIETIRIFEDFAFYDLLAGRRNKRVNDIFQLNGNVYAFDSTTIDLCLKLFPVKFRKYKGGIKSHTLYDAEFRPAFIHITEAKVNDVKAMDSISYEFGSYYVFYCAYNDETTLQDTYEGLVFRCACQDKYKSRDSVEQKTFTQEDLSDCEIELTWVLLPKAYPERIRMVRYWDEDDQREFIY